VEVVGEDINTGVEAGGGNIGTDVTDEDICAEKEVLNEGETTAAMDIGAERDIDGTDADDGDPNGEDKVNWIAEDVVCKTTEE
jgi:hypothetical protein